MQYSHVKFEVGMVFPNLNAFKKATEDYAIYKGKPIKLSKNDKVRYRLFALNLAHGSYVVFGQKKFKVTKSRHLMMSTHVKDFKDTTSRFKVAC